MKYSACDLNDRPEQLWCRVIDCPTSWGTRATTYAGWVHLLQKYEDGQEVGQVRFVNDRRSAIYKPYSVARKIRQVGGWIWLPSNLKILNMAEAQLRSSCPDDAWVGVVETQTDLFRDTPNRSWDGFGSVAGRIRHQTSSYYVGESRAKFCILGWGAILGVLTALHCWHANHLEPRLSKFRLPRLAAKTWLVPGLRLSGILEQNSEYPPYRYPVVGDPVV
jgi:hypothetical protein